MAAAEYQRSGKAVFHQLLAISSFLVVSSNRIVTTTEAFLVFLDGHKIQAKLMGGPQLVKRDNFGIPKCNSLIFATSYYSKLLVGICPFSKKKKKSHLAALTVFAEVVLQVLALVIFIVGSTV